MVLNHIPILFTIFVVLLLTILNCKFVVDFFVRALLHTRQGANYSVNLCHQDSHFTLTAVILTVRRGLHPRVVADLKELLLM